MRLATAFILIMMLSISVTSWSVEEFKVSKYGDGVQIWFEAEAYDDRSRNKNYRLGAEVALDPADGAFGDIVTNAGGDGWLLYRFDISMAGGEAGLWRFIGRILNPSNASDWLWVLGDDGDVIPQVKPAFVRPDHIIFENDSPVWTWVTDGDFGDDGGTVNELQDGENVMMIWTRGSNLTDQYDVFLWSSDLLYKPTDDDYINATDAIAVRPLGALPVLWSKIKSK